MGFAKCSGCDLIRGLSTQSQSRALAHSRQNPSAPGDRVVAAPFQHSGIPVFDAHRVKPAEGARLAAGSARSALWPPDRDRGRSREVVLDVRQRERGAFRHAVVRIGMVQVNRGPVCPRRAPCGVRERVVAPEPIDFERRERVRAEA